MAKMRRRYDREFKISVVAELESGKPLAQIARYIQTWSGLTGRYERGRKAAQGRRARPGAREGNGVEGGGLGSQEKCLSMHLRR